MRFLGVGREKTESQGLSVGTAPREPLPARKVLELQKMGNAELQNTVENCSLLWNPRMLSWKGP